MVDVMQLVLLQRIVPRAFGSFGKMESNGRALAAGAHQKATTISP